MTPRLYCALAIPCSAAILSQRTASASSSGTPPPAGVHESEGVLRLGVPLLGEAESSLERLRRGLGRVLRLQTRGGGKREENQAQAKA